jgi:glycosyltransferase involved in cell wall biosynthesis
MNTNQNSSALRFSLIIATIGRTSELSRFLASLERQTQRSFEVIVVDQNGDDRLVPVLAPWISCFQIRHLRSERGLSRARNHGLAEATGEIITFPDDDCWYAPETLERVKAWFSAYPEFGVLSTCATDEYGKLAAGRWLPASTEITRGNVFRAHISFSLFFRQSSIRAAMGFDERLGLGSGSKYGSGEETDCVLRVMSLGYRAWYERSLAVFHPARLPDSSVAAKSRATSYGLGFGHVLRHHKIFFPRAFYLCLRPAGGWLINVILRRPLSKIYLATLRGRLEGYFSPEA